MKRLPTELPDPPIRATARLLSVTVRIQRAIARLLPTTQCSRALHVQLSHPLPSQSRSNAGQLPKLSGW